jgi:hypothetical protein
MNIKIMNLLVVFSLSANCIQAFSVYLYNNSGEPLSITQVTQKENATFIAKTLDYKVQNNTLLIENADKITINKANNQSITISNKSNQGTYKIFTISGHNLNGANYSYEVPCSSSLKKPYLIIDSEDQNYGYKISAKNYGANT